MNNLFTRSVLVLALFSPWVNASVSSSDDNCNASEGLDGWAIWCGVDTYLAQQEPTAAGPIEGTFEGVVEPDVRTVVFGGELVTPPPPVTPPPVTPVTPPEPEIEYNWQGYAALTHPDFGILQSGELKLKVDTETGEVVGLLTTTLGEEIVFNEGAKFYVAPELIPVIDRPIPAGPSGAAGAVQISQFEVASEARQFDLADIISYSSLLKLVTFPQDWIFTGVGTSFDSEHSSVSTIGQINDGEFAVGSFVAGSLTPLDQMAEFASLGRVASYSGYGIYSGEIGYVANNITVDFSAATWSGEWKSGLDLTSSGIISGNQFSSSAVSGAGVTSGTVQGAFNGNNASTLTGLLDVVKDDQAIIGTFKNVIDSEDFAVETDLPR